MKKNTRIKIHKFLVLTAFFLAPTLIYTHAETAPFAKYAIEGATKVLIQSGVASSYQSGAEIDKSFDGDKSTMYHSSWSSTSFPVTLTYTLNATSDLDYFIYTTRSSGANGNFKEVDVLVRKSGSTAYEKVLTKNFNGSNGSFKVLFDQQLKNVTHVRFSVKSGAGDGNGFAACAEMEFYKKEDGAFDPLTIFKDASCTEIKTGLTRDNLLSVSNPYYKQLALDIFDNNYATEFRVQDFKAWPHPDNFSSANRVGTYSLCDNPTGIFARQGDTIFVFVKEAGDIPVSLTLKNYNKPGGDGYWENTYYGLTKGSNMVIADREGLFYVSYHSTEKYATLPPVKMHFAYARVNGYYDAEKHSAADWTRILNATKYEYFDALGKYAHLSFPTAKFKQNALTTGAQLVAAYNDLVFMEREHMGYYKYPNRDPKNRSHFVVMYFNYMYSTSYHTAYEVSTLDGLTSVTGFKKSPWGPAHEVGHSNQTRPLLNWVGTTEVTNNIHSLLVQTNWGNTSRLIEENRYQNAFRDILIPQNAHADADVFEKLVPFWQIQLLFNNVLGQKDFYASIYEAARTRATGSNNGEYQSNFVKMVVDSAKYDMTEFFEAWGFLKPVNKSIDDYGVQTLTITQTQANSLKNYIKNKNFAKMPYAMQYITDNNWQLYKNRTEVEKGKAARIGSTYRMQDWKNVVAYEAYQDSKLVNVSIDNQINLTGDYTEGSKVYAVQYDGTRIEVTPDLQIEVEKAKLSDNDNTYWYYVKNMGKETGNDPTLRSFTSLNATSAGALVGAVTLPMLQTQKWKMVDVDGKTGLVNEAGLYLGSDLKATTTPFGWTLEAVTQGGSSGYRFANYSGTTLNSVAHLSTSLSLMNYTPADAASVWQFVSDKTIAPSVENNESYYTITTMRMESNLMGKLLAVNNDGALSIDGTKNKWKVVNYNAGTGACNLQNENGKYLYRSGTTMSLSDQATTFYIYMTSFDGVVGYRVAVAKTSGASMLNMSAQGVINSSSTLSNGSLWQFRSPADASGLFRPNYVSLDAYARDGKIFVRDNSDFEVFNIHGQQLVNQNLPFGVYLVKTGKGVAKVIVGR